MGAGEKGLSLKQTLPIDKDSHPRKRPLIKRFLNYFNYLDHICKGVGMLAGLLEGPRIVLTRRDFE
jgi:hypothetical protein